ncbi:hypothetical protein BDQ17DRAFT_1524237 [Cyathus striatus]|nr:hypothetical protein BDQ17DRAFT_1524237 [Cyathus striatus]
MVMNWFVVDDNCYNAPDPIDACTPINIYFDTNLLQLRSGTSDVNRTNQAISQVPIFAWYPEEFSNVYSSDPVFRTTSLLFNSKGSMDPDSSLQNYPFDTYQALLFVYANETIMNTSVYIEVDVSDGVAVGFKTSSNTSLSGDNRYYINEVSLARSGLIKAYVICIVGGVWLVTVAFVGSVMKILFGYTQPNDVFLVPVATLFAFTGLRGTMPGAPAGFGAIIGKYPTSIICAGTNLFLDFAGILPSLAIITAAGVFLFAYKVIHDEDGKVMEPNISAMWKRVRTTTRQNTNELERANGEGNEPPSPGLADVLDGVGETAYTDPAHDRSLNTGGEEIPMHPIERSTNKLGDDENIESASPILLNMPGSSTTLLTSSNSRIHVQDDYSREGMAPLRHRGLGR